MPAGIAAGGVSMLRERLRAAAPAIEAHVGSRVDPAAAVVRQGYLTISLAVLGEGGTPVVVGRTSLRPALDEFLEWSTRCASEAIRLGVSSISVLDSGRVCGRAYQVTTWLAGRLLDTGRGPEAAGVIGRDVDEAFREVTRLHALSRREADAGDDVALRARIRWWRGLVGSCAQAATVLGALENALPRLPRVLMHGDATPGNLVHAGDRWGFIDWEMGLTAGLPYVDAISLLLDRSGRAAHLDRAAAYRRCFVEPGRMARSCASLLEWYVDELGLDRDLLPLMAAATHVKMVAEDRHFSLLHDGPRSAARALEPLAALSGSPVAP